MVQLTCDPALGRWSQKGQELRVILGYTAILRRNQERERSYVKWFCLFQLCSRNEPRDNSPLGMLGLHSERVFFPGQNVSRK